MKQIQLERKDNFRLLGKIFLCLVFITFTAQATITPANQSAREQINTQVLKQAGRDIDTLTKKKGWQDYRYQLNVYIPSTAASASHCTAPLKLDHSPAQTNISRLNYLVTCPDNNGWRMQVAVRANVYVPVVMPKHVIDRGEMLENSDLVMRKYNLSTARRDILMNINDAVGKSSKRALEPGKPITANELDMPILVKRNQEVMIVSHMENITAQTEGVALKNGRKGDVIKVRNESSQRVVSAVVKDTGLVSTLNSDG